MCLAASLCFGTPTFALALLACFCRRVKKNGVKYVYAKVDGSKNGYFSQVDHFSYDVKTRD